MVEKEKTCLGGVENFFFVSLAMRSTIQVGLHLLILYKGKCIQLWGSVSDTDTFIQPGGQGSDKGMGIKLWDFSNGKSM